MSTPLFYQLIAGYHPGTLVKICAQYVLTQQYAPNPFPYHAIHDKKIE